jgi:hypothetical protein
MDPQIDDQRQQQAESLHATVEGADCARRVIAWILFNTGWNKWQESSDGLILSSISIENPHVHCDSQYQKRRPTPQREPLSTLSIRILTVRFLRF